MARDTHTPISYFMGMPIKSLVEWIQTANRVTEKMERERQNGR